MIDRILEGVPVYINPLLDPGTLVQHCKGTPQEFFVADSFDTVQRAIDQANESARTLERLRAVNISSCLPSDPPENPRQ